MTFAIVNCQLLALPDVSERVELGTIRSQPGEGVRHTGMIDEAEAATGGRGIDSHPGEFDNRNDPPAFGAPSRFPDGNHFAFEFADFRPGGDRTAGKDAAPGNATGGHRELVVDGR